jgi:hypothetical protein
MKLKTPSTNSGRVALNPARVGNGGSVAPKRGEDGSITLVLTILLIIMMILVTAEIRALHHLGREVKFLEKQQIKRLNGTATNTVTAKFPPAP